MYVYVCMCNHGKMERIRFNKQEKKGNAGGDGWMNVGFDMQRVMMCMVCCGDTPKRKKDRKDRK